MTRLLNFARTQKRRRDRVFCIGMEEMGGLYSSSRENINERSFNEG